MSLQAHGEVVPVAFQRLELPGPIDDSLPHCRPLVATAVGFRRRVLAMAVANAFLWQEIVPIRKRFFAALRSVSRIPIEHEIGRRDCRKNFDGLSRSRGIASGLVF